MNAGAAVSHSAADLHHIPPAISLIIPPSGFLLDDRVFMTLGILRIAAVLEQAGTHVEVLDLSGISNYGDAVADHARASASKLFGITATTPQLPAAMEILRVLRRVIPHARVILGGPHATLCNAARKLEEKSHVTDGRAHVAIDQLTRAFDVVVAGDGEAAIFAACHPDAPTLIDADDRRSPLFLTDKRLNALPWPARHLVDIDSYHYQIEGVPALSLIAQLGCPFACGFCGGRQSSMLRIIRTRTTENIIAEMEHLWRTTGKAGFMFYDDELNVNKNMVELMRAIRRKQDELGVEWRLRGFVKAELFTDEQAEAMYAAGFRWLLIGFESGADQILLNINKRATRADNTRAIEIATRHGLKVKALMSMGHPGETPETIEQTLQWLLSVRPADFDVSVITCYPGTPYYDEAVRHATLPGTWTYTYAANGHQLHQIDVDYTTTADYYKGNPEGGYHAYVFTDALSSVDLVQQRDRVERTVRDKLNIPFNTAAAATLYEHSMGQSALPSFVFRSSQHAR